MLRSITVTVITGNFNIIHIIFDFFLLQRKREGDEREGD